MISGICPRIFRTNTIHWRDPPGDLTDRDWARVRVRFLRSDGLEYSAGPRRLCFPTVKLRIPCIIADSNYLDTMLLSADCGLEDLKYGIFWPFAPKSTYVSLLKTSSKVYTSFSCCLSAGKVWFSFSVCVYFCEVILKISRCKILNNIFYLRKNRRKTINYSAYFELWICSRIQDIADTGQVEKNIISNEVDCELMCSEVCRTSWKHREVYCE